jgi:hypothetical protein
MAEIVRNDERVREGNAALARGAWADARAIFEQELQARESVDALEGLSWAAWWVEDVATCIHARERACRLSRREGDLRRAAMLALWVGDDYLILRGERAIANGWFQRAGRILEALDTCPEHGWLDALLGYVATIDGGLEEARKLAIQARKLGQPLDVVSLEMFALAVEGLALVNAGEVADGMRYLDEATAAALAGEFEEIVAAGWTFCFLLNACERVRDFERAAEWCRRVEESAAGCEPTSSPSPVGPTTAPCSPGTAAGPKPRSRSPRRSASPSSVPLGATSRSCDSPPSGALRRGRGVRRRLRPAALPAVRWVSSDGGVSCRTATSTGSSTSSTRQPLRRLASGSSFADRMPPSIRCGKRTLTSCPWLQPRRSSILAAGLALKYAPS